MSPTTPMSDRSAAPGGAHTHRNTRCLRDFVNAKVIQHCDKIAGALVNKPADRNTRLLARLAGIEMASGRDKPRKKAKGPNWAQLLVLEQECEANKAAEKKWEEECAAIRRDKALGLPTPPEPPYPLPLP